MAENRIYAGIGSKSKTPDVICDCMFVIARRLAEKGWTLRSGGAPLADESFESGCDLVGGKKEIFLPWRGFRGRSDWIDLPLRYQQLAHQIAEQHHPAWGKCKPAHRKLHSRNSHQVLGVNLETPVEVVICYTADGKASGGTGQAMRIAERRGITILNLFYDEHLDAALKLE